VMLSYSWQLAMPVLLLSVVLLLVMARVQRLIAERFAAARSDLARMQGVVAESVIGAGVIRSTGSDDRIRTRLDAAVDRARDSQLRTLVPLHANTSLGELAISTMTTTVVLGGVWWSLLGDPARPRLSVGQVVAMVLLVTFFVRPLQFLVQSLGEAQNAVTGWRRALEVAVTPSARVRDGEALPEGPLSVELREVSARYGRGPRVLHGVSARIEAGEHVAIVGRTGSGKSTFAKLVTGRLDPDAGELLLGGIPRDRIRDGALARRVVIVPQDPFLFTGTLADNVRLGATRSTDDDVLRVLDALGLTDWFTAVPDGLRTQVGLRGERLSVGERQLLALARTALADPDLVVLDEATSGIDPATDVAVQAALAAVSRGRTTLSIAHRMITAASADRVLVFDAGRLVQSGPHDVLLSQDGPYAGLVHAWESRNPAPPPAAPSLPIHRRTP
jgi:ATP-binding cassette subfamily B protein